MKVLKTFTTNMETLTPLSRKQIEYMVQVSGRFSSRVLLTHRNRTINGKSMLGLLSLGATGSDPVQVDIEGEDEAEAAQVIRKILENGIILPKGVADAEALLARIKNDFADILQDRLVGLYVHGSLAWGCFRWEKSDIDLLLVTSGDLPVETKEKLCRVLHEMEPDAPDKGFEMCVLTEKDCKHIVYPTPFILHYSKMHSAAFAEDARAYVEHMNGLDPDIVCHIAEARTACKVLLGPGVNRMFGAVSRKDLLDSISRDLSDAPEQLHSNPVYYVLNLCRAMALRQDGVMLSKQDGGAWGIKHMNQIYQGIIQAAVNAYRNGTDMSYDRGPAEDLIAEYLPYLEEKWHD